MADPNPTPSPAALQAYDAALADLAEVAAIQREIASNVHFLPVRARTPSADECRAECTESLNKLDPVWNSGDRLTMDWLNARCMKCGQCPEFMAKRGLMYIGGA